MAPSNALRPAVCVLAHWSIVGTHVGLCYKDEPSKTDRVIEQRWHYNTSHVDLAAFLSEAPGQVWWVANELDPDERYDLGARAALVANQLAARELPYAFALKDGRFDGQGKFIAGKSSGVSCATFLMLLFRAAGVNLLNDASWTTGRDEVRRAEDADAQQRVVDELEKQAGLATDPKERQALTNHAKKIKAEKDCTRFRAEEVAMASGAQARPADYAEIEPEGRRLVAATTRGAHRFSRWPPLASPTLLVAAAPSLSAPPPVEPSDAQIPTVASSSGQEPP
ncbi:MAG: hypothetical protein JNK72_09310 [Myxococcales bacterium]|nr:hypothetical protein [Myxococcales bacterium]